MATPAETGPKRKRRAEAEADDPEFGDLTIKPAGLTAVEQKAFQKLLAAIAERRLLPGVRLVEEDLARVFDVSRERIRRILLVLSQHEIVRLEPNRGAYVARPSFQERRDAFEVRRLIERSVVASLAALGPARRRMIVAHLRRHVVAEDVVVAAGDRAAEIRLSGEFHLKMAAYAGNLRLLRVLQEVIAQMSLSLAAHTNRHDLDCSIGEHRELLDAILEGDAARADHLLRAHLEHMEDALAVGINDDGSLMAAIDPA